MQNNWNDATLKQNCHKPMSIFILLKYSLVITDSEANAL